MISAAQYFRDRKASAEVEMCADELLARVNALLDFAEKSGIKLKQNPLTGCLIAGQTEGGFRLPDCTQGAQNSSHKEGRGIDLFDPLDALDNWLTDKILSAFNLYREHPSATKGWCHLTTRAPKSGRRSFYP